MVNLDVGDADDKAQELMQTIPLHRWSAATKILIVGLILLGIGVPLLTQIDPQDQSVWLAVAVTVAVLGVSTAIFALILMAEIPSRKKRLAKMLMGERLAHWTYSSKEWERYQQTQVNRRDDCLGLESSMFVACTMVGAIVGGIAILATLRWEDYRMETVAIAFGSGFFFCLIANFFEWIGWVGWCRRLENRKGEALISEHGIYFHSIFYSWESFGSSLQSIDVLKDGPIRVLRFVVAFQTKNGESERTLEVPVPKGGDTAAIRQRLVG